MQVLYDIEDLPVVKSNRLVELAKGKDPDEHTPANVNLTLGEVARALMALQVVTAVFGMEEAAIELSHKLATFLNEATAAAAS